MSRQQHYVTPGRSEELSHHVACRENENGPIPLGKLSSDRAKKKSDHRIGASERKRPPEPPRTAFMCFSASREMEMQYSYVTPGKDREDLIQNIAAEWRNLSPDDKAQWDEAARDDKLRYMMEKNQCRDSCYQPKKRAKKHPLAPKRPMSAFLKFSQVYRGEVKLRNPSLANTDVSRLLGEMWRTASPEVKEKYIIEEQHERVLYKRDVGAFRLRQRQMEMPSHNSFDQKCSHHFQSTPYNHTEWDDLGGRKVTERPGDVKRPIDYKIHSTSRPFHDVIPVHIYDDLPYRESRKISGNSNYQSTSNYFVRHNDRYDHRRCY